MSRLKKMLDEKHKALERKDERKISNTSVREKRRKDRTKRKIYITVVIIAAVIGFIYIPQIFMKPEGKENEYIINPDVTRVAFAKNAPQNCPQEDFDNDGINNMVELAENLDPWSYDTDNDGMSDYDERARGTNPRVKDVGMKAEIIAALNKEEKDYDSAYSYNNVILWAKNENSRVYGGVIRTYAGYQFTEFEGYAAFPEDGYAYKYEDGYHTLLDYDSKNKRWKIEEDCLVIIYPEKLEETIRLGFFGKKGYVKDNGFTSFLAKILPDYGFLTGKNFVKSDTDVDTEKDTIVEVLKSNVKEVGKERFQRNNLELEDIALLRKYIDEGYSVPVSLYDSNDGELFCYIKGYTQYGDYILADIDTYETIGKLRIIPMSKNYIDAELKPYQKTSYRFVGMGFDSDSGDRISYIFK